MRTYEAIPYLGWELKFGGRALFKQVTIFVRK